MVANHFQQRGMVELDPFIPKFLLISVQPLLCQLVKNLTKMSPLCICIGRPIHVKVFSYQPVELFKMLYILS